MMMLTEDLSEGTEVDVTVVGIKAPLATQPAFHLLIMDKSADEGDRFRDDTALYYLKG